MLLLPRLINLLNLRRRQLKCRRPQIVAQTLLLARRRDGHNVLIDAPSERDLARADGVLLGESGHHVVDWAGGRAGDCG